MFHIFSHAEESMKSNKIRKIYNILLSNFGRQDWWPADNPFEVAVGAILTQNTTWNNVEKAIENLKNNNLLNPEAIKNASINTLSKYIKPAGYYNVKARYLNNFSTQLVSDFKGKMEYLESENLSFLRKWLLDIKGIGNETANSIMNYALNKPVFVVDKYTERIFRRHNIIDSNASYSNIHKLVENSFKISDHKKNLILGELHALIVKTGKEFCKKRAPECKRCPLYNKI